MSVIIEESQESIYIVKLGRNDLLDQKKDALKVIEQYIDNYILYGGQPCLNICLSQGLPPDVD